MGYTRSNPKPIGVGMEEAVLRIIENSGAEMESYRRRRFVDAKKTAEPFGKAAMVNLHPKRRRIFLYMGSTPALP